MYDKPKLSTRCIIHEIPHEIKTRTAVEGASLPVPSLTGSPHGDGQAGRDIAKILQRLVESGIERWRDTFKMPMLVKEQENVSLCFSTDGSPVVERGRILYFADGNSPSYVEVLCGSRMGNSGEGDITLVLIPPNDLLRHPISNRVFHITKRLAKNTKFFTP